MLTDPAFDPAGTVYPLGAYSLHKTEPPALMPPARRGAAQPRPPLRQPGPRGRALLSEVEVVLTTSAGVGRLGHGATGLVPWQETDLCSPDGRVLRVTATPARHGPAHADLGPVIGFVLAFLDDPSVSLYLSGDTVWYEGVQEAAARFPVRAALLFMGAARIPAVGPWHLTFTAAEGVKAARALAPAAIVPLHFEGWEHFSESRPEIDRAFANAGLERRLRWLKPGVSTEFQTGRPGRHRDRGLRRR